MRCARVAEPVPHATWCGGERDSVVHPELQASFVLLFGLHRRSWKGSLCGIHDVPRGNSWVTLVQVLSSNRRAKNTRSHNTSVTRSFRYESTVLSGCLQFVPHACVCVFVPLIRMHTYMRLCIGTSDTHARLHVSVSSMRLFSCCRRCLCAAVLL